MGGYFTNGSNWLQLRPPVQPIPTQLAKKINRKQKDISGYGTGATLPSLRTPLKIAKVLKRSAGYFLDKQGEEAKKINLHKNFKGEERPIYNSFRSVFECFKLWLCHSSFGKME